jgi:hypothetical protein
MPDRPVCPMCHEPGIHPTPERCLEELRATIDRLKRIRAMEPSVRDLGRFVPSYVE